MTENQSRIRVSRYTLNRLKAFEAQEYDSEHFVSHDEFINELMDVWAESQ